MRKHFARPGHRVNAQQMLAFTKQREKCSQLLGTSAGVILGGLPTSCSCSFTGGLMKLLEHWPNHDTQPLTCSGSQQHPRARPGF